MRFAAILFLSALCAQAQPIPIAPTNRTEAISNAPTTTLETQTSARLSEALRVEQMRATCIQNRRRICGKILKILPDGLVVDSGYTNLTRTDLGRSWLVPGTVEAARATNVVEQRQTGSLCIGLVFLNDLPKQPGAKPKLHDYVNLEAFPAGQYTYASVGDLHRTVRKFSAKLPSAIQWHLDESKRQSAPAK